LSAYLKECFALVRGAAFEYNGVAPLLFGDKLTPPGVQVIIQGNPYGALPLAYPESQSGMITSRNGH
jgi:hypothetical protein